ncbi:MAG: hypothetical protein C4297_13940 [Gemmataceae bacterium]
MPMAGQQVRRGPTGRAIFLAQVGSLAISILFCLVIWSSGGCTRPFFRRLADREVVEVIQEKNVDPAWELTDYYVYPHPLARFADPSDPDHPPMPPDDPAAWFTAPRPQRPKSVAYLEQDSYLTLLEEWDRDNRARKGAPKQNSPPAEAAGEALGDATDCSPNEGAGAEQCAGFDPTHGRPSRLSRRQRPYLITLDQAVELALINSREYQTRREDLYLAALPVTFQRFAFASQFELTGNVVREWAARRSSVGKQNRWTSASQGQMRKLFSTGALLLVQVANQTAINLTGNRPHTVSQSTLVLDLSQPLLRGGGRAVTLEPLTQTERTLLYELRNFARFQKSFFVAIAAGGPTLAGGGAGAGIAGLQLAVRGQAAQVGYYPTLLRLAQLQNERQNVEALRRLLDFFEASLEGGQVSGLQVDQVEQDYLRAQATVLQREVDYADALDQFKIQLGLPTELPLELDDSPLEVLRAQMRRYEDIEAAYQETLRELEKLESKALAPADLRQAVESLLKTSRLLQGTRFLDELHRSWPAWRALGIPYDQYAAPVADFAALMGAPGVPGPIPMNTLTAPALPSLLARRIADLQVRRQSLLEQRDRLRDAGKPVPPDLEDQLRLLTRELDLGALELALGFYALQPWLAEKEPARQRQAQIAAFRRVAFQMALLLEGGRAERLKRLAETWPALPPVMVQGKDLLALREEEALDLAGRVALENRLDLMNQRAQLADAWRKIAVFANSLLGVFDVRYHMEVMTPPGLAQPLNFQGERSRHQIALNFELPLVRKLERNNYRASLIAFQRQRRELMAAEDQVLFSVRTNIRQLRQLLRNYEIQKRALELAYLQVDNALETFRAPPDPRAQRDTATAAAALTQQLLNAQRSVPQAQNQVFTVWVNYLTTRMELYRDLELMRFDSRGVWIDDFSEPPPADNAASRPGAGYP